MTYWKYHDNLHKMLSFTKTEWLYLNLSGAPSWKRFTLLIKELLKHHSSKHMLTFSTVLGSITLFWVINYLTGLTSSNLGKVHFRQDLRDLSIIFATVFPIFGCHSKFQVMEVLNSSTQLLRIFLSRWGVCHRLALAYNP